MPARLEIQVRSGDPIARPLPAEPAVPPPRDPATTAREAAARESRRLEMETRVRRWKAIHEAGSIENWIEGEIRTQGLSTADLDPAKLKNDAERQAYKDKKHAEAEARRELARAAWKAFHATHVVHLGAGVHWDESPDPDRFDSPDREERAKANGLPDWKTPDDVATALGMTVAKLRWLTYQREVDSGSHYRRWSIPKRSGGTRVIAAPKKDLKEAQRKALELVFEKLPVHGAAHGFLAGRSIVTNARFHAGADLLVKLDVKDFFPSITWRRVKGLLRRSGMREGPATLLALLATESPRQEVDFRGRTWHVATGPRATPQGAPTSPAISNALCLHLDRRLAGLARKLGLKYTRYADDLAFSWSPRKGASKQKPPLGILLGAVTRIVESEGFRINPEKTRILRSGTRQRLTGLVINRPPLSLKREEPVPPARLPRETVRRLRAAIHNREKGKPGKEGESLAQIKGMAAFLHMTDPGRGRQLLDRIAALEARPA